MPPKPNPLPSLTASTESLRQLQSALNKIVTQHFILTPVGKYSREVCLGQLIALYSAMTTHPPQKILRICLRIIISSSEQLKSEMFITLAKEIANHSTNTDNSSAEQALEELKSQYQAYSRKINKSSEDDIEEGIEPASTNTANHLMQLATRETPTTPSLIPALTFMVHLNNAHDSYRPENPNKTFLELILAITLLEETDINHSHPAYEHWLKYLYQFINQIDINAIDISLTIKNLKVATSHPPMALGSFDVLHNLTAKYCSFSDAHATLSASITLNPERAQTYINRGKISIMLEHYQEAKQDFSAALTLDSSRSYYTFLIALLSFKKTIASKAKPTPRKYKTAATQILTALEQYKITAEDCNADSGLRTLLKDIKRDMQARNPEFQAIDNDLEAEERMRLALDAQLTLETTFKQRYCSLISSTQNTPQSKKMDESELINFFNELLTLLSSKDSYCYFPRTAEPTPGTGTKEEINEALYQIHLHMLKTPENSQHRLIYSFTPHQGNLSIGKIIYSGPMSKVFYAQLQQQDSTPVDVIAKQVKTTNIYHCLDLLNEVNQFRQLAHPNIVTCLGFYIQLNTEGFLLTLLEEKMDCSLFNVISKELTTLSETDLIKIISDMLTGIAELHRKGIIHRDLKPENILIRVIDGTYTAKLTDLGSAVNILHDNLAPGHFNHSKGTPCYRAPESQVIINRPAADIFSFGVILYELCGGKKLLHDKNLLWLLAKTNQLPSLVEELSCPSLLKEFILQCWKPEALRPTAEWLLSKLHSSNPNPAATGCFSKANTRKRNGDHDKNDSKYLQRPMKKTKT